jgi:ribose-phosphate pyrophosphokinase
MNLKIFPGVQNRLLAEGIAKSLSLNLGKIKHHQFPSGETWCQYGENIRESDLFIVEQVANPANEGLMRILVMADAARRASAGRITAVIPYFGYARQDRKDASRVPISAKMVMNILEAAGIKRILTMDLHNPAIQGFTDMPVDHLYSMPLFFEALNLTANPEEVVFVSPDIGAMKRTEEYMKALKGSTFGVCPKTRVNESKVITHPLVGDVNGKVAILPDDITESCGTILGAAKQCKENGAKKVYGCIAHGLITAEGYDRLAKDQYLDALYVTNGNSVDVPANLKDKVKIVDSAPAFAKAIRRINSGESVSDLFQIK